MSIGISLPRLERRIRTWRDAGIVPIWLMGGQDEEKGGRAVRYLSARDVEGRLDHRTGSGRFHWPRPAAQDCGRWVSHRKLAAPIRNTLVRPLGARLRTASAFVPTYLHYFRYNMALNGILSSRSQRRQLLVLWFVVLGLGVLAVVILAPLAEGHVIGTTLTGGLASIVASGIFALVTALYSFYVLVDPYELSASSILLPQDVGPALEGIAQKATSYSISVRTGRHFRAEILPVLVKQARKLRQPINVEVVLLDFRDGALCDKYANYRKTSSFDSKSWDTQYVQKEVLATILNVIEASRANRDLMTINLYLSRRLSTFRIEGSPDEMLVTREDPKDTAARYRRDHRDFPAYVNELKWIRDEAYRIQPADDGGLPATLTDMFVGDALVASLEGEAKKAANSRSPYAR